MTRRMMMAMMMVASLLAVGASPAGAHDEIRVIGTVVRVGDTSLVLRTGPNLTVTMTVSRQTVVFRQGTNRQDVKATLADVKPGLYVVADAYGDSEDGAHVDVLRIVPPPARR